MRRATIEVVFDPHNRGEVDGDEWAYTLRMGGIDAEEAFVVPVDERAGRAAVATLVAEVERLGGCIDEACEHEDCWLGRMPDGPVREEVRRAILFVTERTIDGETTDA